MENYTVPSLLPTILPIITPSNNFNVFNITELDPISFEAIENSAHELGYMVSSAGDFNGDGKVDYLVGAPHTGQNAKAGAVYLVLGGDNNNNITLSSNFVNTGKGFSIVGGYYLGYSLTGIGDFNNDGYDDIAMATPCQNVYIIYGKPNNFYNIDPSTNYIDPNDGFIIALKYQISGNPYIAIAGIGDHDKDGIPDIAIAGATYASSTIDVAVIFGSESNINIDLGKTDLVDSNKGYNIFGIHSEFYTGGHLTKTLSTAGDFDGDGGSDFLVGAYNVAYLIKSGNNFVNFNISDLTVDRGFNITCSTKNCNLGLSVSDAGDINDDGKADILVAGSKIIGVIYGTDANNITNISVNDLGGLGFTITTDQTNNIVSSGKYYYDNCSDILIGSKNGIVYVINGEKQNNNITINQNHISGALGYAIVDSTKNSLFGSTLSTIKNPNKDGLDGIIIGAPQTNNNDGKAYVAMVTSSSFPTHYPTSAPTDNTESKHLRGIGDKVLEETIIPIGIVFLAAAGYYTYNYYFKYYHTSGYNYMTLQSEPRPSALPP